MGLLNALDLAVIAFYLIGITWLGSRFYEKGVGLKEYLLGNKAMRWFPVALSILAADTSVITYLGAPAWSYQHDIKLSVGMLAYLLGIPIVIWLFLPIYSKGTLYTAYQYLEQRFDLRVRLVASFFFLLVRGSHVSVIIYAPALVMSELMGVPLSFSILAMGALTGLYTALGGIKAVIWTDTLQVTIVILGFTLLASTALMQIPGGLVEVWQVGWAHGKFEMFDFSFSANQVDNFWALALGGTLLAVQAMSTDQAVLQKFFTTKSSRETSKSLLFYGATTVPLVGLLYVLGVILFVFYSKHPEVRATLQNPDAVVAHYAARMLPHGLAGVLVASIFAGAMSTVSASINSLATSSVVDIYRRLIRKDAADQHYTTASRWATVLWGALATIGAFYASRLGSLVLAFTKIQSLMGGVILGIFLLGVLSQRIGANAALVGTVAGLAIVSASAAFTPVSIYWYCVIGCFSTLLVSWLYSLFGMQRIEASQAEV